MSDDLEIIPIERGAAPPVKPPLPPSPRWRRPPAVVSVLGLAAVALSAGVLLSGGSKSSAGSGRKTGQEAISAGDEIVCPPGQGLAGTLRRGVTGRSRRLSG